MKMRLVGLAAFVAAFLTAGVSSAAESDVLYWMVDSGATVTRTDGTTATISDYFANPSPDVAVYGSDYAARVRVTGGDIQSGQNVFLDLYTGDGIDKGGGQYGVSFDNGSGYWGAGVPTGNQSPSGDYSAGTPEYSFVVELGNIDASDNWTTVATSASATYSSLADYIHKTFDLNPGQTAVWTPSQFHAVPEPSSGLLALIGTAVLALRRKRRTKEA